MIVKGQDAFRRPAESVLSIDEFEHALEQGDGPAKKHLRITAKPCITRFHHFITATPPIIARQDPLLTFDKPRLRQGTTKSAEAINAG